MLNNDLVIKRIEEAIKTTQAFTQFDDSYNRTSLKTLEKLETALIFAKKGGVGVCVLRDEVKLITVPLILTTSAFQPTLGL